MIDLETFYALVDGDEKEVISRFNGNEDMVLRFVKKFLNDDSFSILSKAIENSDVKTAFRGAHSLKGVASTLGLQNLYSVSYSITELLRAENLEEAKKAFPEVKKIYNQTCDYIKEL